MESEKRSFNQPIVTWQCAHFHPKFYAHFYIFHINKIDPKIFQIEGIRF
jgi:hypothetical protein